MAGPYYVDLSNPGAWNGNTGLDHVGEQWLGLSGYQYARDTITVGNGPVYVKGSAAGNTLKTLVCDNQSGNFVRGEEVTWDSESSTGVVSEIIANLPTVIEVISGTLADDDNLTGTTSGATADVAGAPATKGNAIDSDTNAGGSSIGFIKFIAMNASWAVDGSYASIDATGNTNGLACEVGFIWDEYFEYSGADNDGINQDSSGADNFVLKGNYIHNNGQYGCHNNNAATNGIYFRNRITNNTAHGMFECGFCHIVGNAIYGNGGNGIESGSSDYSNASKNVIFDNGDGSENFDFDKNWFIMNNVIDGTGQLTATGLHSSGSGQSIIIENRITNCATEGLDNNNDVNVYGLNVFHNNGLDVANTLVSETIDIDSTTDSNRYDVDADDGYNNTGNMDYNLKADRTYNQDGNDAIGLGIGS